MFMFQWLNLVYAVFILIIVNLFNIHFNLLHIVNIRYLIFWHLTLVIELKFTYNQNCKN